MLGYISERNGLPGITIHGRIFTPRRSTHPVGTKRSHELAEKTWILNEKADYIEKIA